MKDKPMKIDTKDTDTKKNWAMKIAKKYVNSKYSQDYLSKLFQYTLGEDIANAVSHTVGVFFGLYAIINLTWVAARYGDWLDSLAFIIYGLTILFMFLMSTLYHSMVNPTARTVFKKLDHVAIYILILGSYTPIVFSLLRFDRAYAIYLVLAICTLVGVIFKALHAGKFKKISTLLYIMMGWGALALLPAMWKVMPITGLCFLLAGGAAYSTGALLYAFGRFKYLHMVWHIFVIFGVVFQYISITFFILQYRV
jgi:hemolysin III